MKYGLLGRPRLLLGLVLLEALLVAPIGWLFRVLLGRGADMTLRTDALVQLDARAWAELLFVDQPRFAALLLPLGVALLVWWLVGAALPATFFSSLALGERGVLVAERTARHAPALWRLAARGVLLRLVLLVPSALVGGALLRGARSFEDLERGVIGMAGVALPALILATVWIDIARLLSCVGEARPIAMAWVELRRQPIRLFAIALGYAAIGALLLVGYVVVAPAMGLAASATAVWLWQGLFVTARLVVASGRLLWVQAILTDSK